MNRRHLTQKIFSLIFICGLLTLILVGNHNQVNSQTQPEEYFQVEPTPTPDETIVMFKKLLEKSTISTLRV